MKGELREILCILGLMKNSGEIGLEFLIDKLTRSIENIITGDSFPTEITSITNQQIFSR
jgi:hypothetical protein